MEQETDKMEDGKECEDEYSVGDLLWAKIGHFPYWPCMVSYDPFSGAYQKKKKIRSGDAIVYHVQYFGEKIQHGWTTPGLVMKYEGEKAFYDKKEQLIATKSSYFRYNIPSKDHKAWTVAVKEAEEARKYDDIEERYESYVFKYEYDSKKSTPSEENSTKKRKRNQGSSKKPKKAKELNGTDSRVCSICDKGNVDLLCSGSCSQYFHQNCLGLLVAPNNFRCVHCEKGLATCFVCKKSATTIFHCNKCNLKYHHECIKVFPCVRMLKNLCSHHGCLTCERKKNYKHKGTLVNCIRCPTSFHANIECLPAGSVKLSTTTMICPDHFWGKNKVSPQPTSNVSYCYSCCQGGTLICCESCPNSFHAECIGKDVPKEDFFCENCEKRQFLYVGMIIWVKTGKYRFWPAQIVDVEDVPPNVKNMKKYDGEFPIYFFGTNEYFWTHRGRVIPYSIDHKDLDPKCPKQKRLDEQFEKGLQQAAAAFDEHMIKQRMLSADKGNEYKRIKVNRLVPPAQIDTSVSKSYPCSCNQNVTKPILCVKGSPCLNASTNTECDPRQCNCGVLCENQKFQRRQYAEVKLFKTENRGWGLKADQFIDKGTFVIEYVGEIITHEEYRRRVVDMQERNEQNYYFLYLDSRRMIDAGPAGNLARFINHACTANCVMSKWSVNGDARIGIFALEDIPAGTELTFNYQYDDINFQHRCLCGTANCQGFFGKKKEKGKSSKEGLKKKSKKKVKKM